MVPDRLAENLAEVRGRIDMAAARSARTADAVRLVAITKYASSGIAAKLVECGCLDLGESRPQELWRKADALGSAPIRWHLVGHLQRNKIDRTLPVVSCIHSVDSWRLLQAMDSRASALGLQHVPSLLEINISGERAKQGLAPDEAPRIIAQAAAMTHVRIQGLMGMAGLYSDRDQVRREFRSLRELRDRLRPECSPRVSMDELSMGMSADFELAVEEGATMVRVGSALFEGVVA